MPIWLSSCMILLFLISRPSFSLFSSASCCMMVPLQVSSAVFSNSLSGSVIGKLKELWRMELLGNLGIVPELVKGTRLTGGAWLGSSGAVGSSSSEGWNATSLIPIIDLSSRSAEGLCGSSRWTGGMEGLSRLWAGLCERRASWCPWDWLPGMLGAVTLPAIHSGQYQVSLFQFPPLLSLLSVHLLWNIRLHLPQQRGWSLTCVALGSIFEQHDWQEEAAGWWEDKSASLIWDIDCWFAAM